MNRGAIASALLVLTLSWARPAAAQEEDYSFQAGVQLAGAVSSEFDSTDLGIGGRFGWQPTSFFGAEAEVSFYPGDFAGERAFSSSRVEGLFGVTAGPRLGRLRPFARIRPGFVSFQEAPEPFPCILIYPPPLPCTLAAGQTIFAIDFGGGVEMFPTSRTFLRVDAGDRVVRYPGPSFDLEGTRRDEAFFSHDFRFTVGGGLRF